MTDHVHEDDEEIALDEGMPVATADGDDLGALASVLVDEETDEAAFLVVAPGSGDPRLVPFEAVVDVEDGKLLLDVEQKEFTRLPRADMSRDPTPDEIELAYKVLGYEAEEDEE